MAPIPRCTIGLSSEAPSLVTWHMLPVVPSSTLLPICQRYCPWRCPTWMLVITAAVRASAILWGDLSGGLRHRRQRMHRRFDCFESCTRSGVHVVAARRTARQRLWCCKIVWGSARVSRSYLRIYATICTELSYLYLRTHSSWRDVVQLPQALDTSSGKFPVVHHGYHQLGRPSCFAAGLRDGAPVACQGSRLDAAETVYPAR